MFNKITTIIASIVMICTLTVLAYAGLYLQSIHINDEITAVYVGLVALILDIYICYISIKEFWKNKFCI